MRMCARLHLVTARMHTSMSSHTDACTDTRAQVGENMGEAAGMRIKLIDTVGLEDAESGDAVNLQVSEAASNWLACFKVR